MAVLVVFLGLSPCFSQTAVAPATLPSPAPAGSSPAFQTPFDARLATLQAAWKAQTPVERAVTLLRVYQLREYVSSPHSIAMWVRNLAQDNSEPAPLRADAAHYAALMDLHDGVMRPIPPLAPGVLAAAQAAVSVNPNSATFNEALGLLEGERGISSDHLQQSAHLAPTAARWMEVARRCADPACTYPALTAALQADANDAGAKVALADYYAARKQASKARDLLREAVANDRANFVARKRLADLYASAGLNARALAEYRSLEREFPGPLWLRRELAAAYEKLGFLDQALALANAVLAENFDDGVTRDLVIRIHRRRGDAAGLRRCYADMLRIDPDDTDALARVAELDAGAGNVHAAEAELRRAIDIDPDSVPLRQQFADVLAGAGKPVQARQQLARALDTNPDEDGLRRRIAWDRGASVGTDPDAAYLVNAAAITREASQAPADDSAATALADIRIERIQENGLSSLHLQQITRINTDQGAREYASRTVQYAAGAQELRMAAARLFKPDGRVIDAEESGDAATDEGTAAMYYDARSRIVRFPGIEKGDIIELEYRLTPDTNTNPYGRYFGNLVTFRSSVPERLQRYVLIAPTGQKLNVMQVHMPAAEMREQGGQRIYRWEARDVAALPNEPKGPALTDIAPYVHVSSFAGWDEVGRWYAQLIAPQFELDAALRQALSRLLAGKTTEQEKIQAIHQFVLRNTHYVALEFGIYGYKPYPVSQVFARRFGDCKDKASLMIALLRAAGIDADIALVRTRRLGDIGEQAASIAVFNHAVVYVPKYDLWLDGTAEYAGSRELPLEDQGAMALTVGLDGSAQLRRIPVTLPMENYTHRQVQARILGDGRIEFTGSAYVRGEDAPGLRREYEVAERQRDSVRNRLAEVLPSVRVDAVQVYGANDLEHDLTVKFSGEVQMFAARPSLPTSWMPRSYVQTLASLGSRSQDLLLPAPWTTEEELHFVLPAGARLDSVPEDKTIDTPFGSAVLRYQRQGSELVVTTSVQFRKLRITPSEYRAFREFCAQVESAFRAEIKVGLKG